MLTMNMLNSIFFPLSLSARPMADPSFGGKEGEGRVRVLTAIAVITLTLILSLFKGEEMLLC